MAFTQASRVSYGPITTVPIKAVPALQFGSWYVGKRTVTERPGR